jgi:hypothetical protein
MASDLEALQFMAAPRQRPQPQSDRVPLHTFVANILREAKRLVPGSRAAYVSPNGTEFIVCGDGGGTANYRKVAELSGQVARFVMNEGGPYISGRYVPFDEAPEDWVVAFRDR